MYMYCKHFLITHVYIVQVPEWDDLMKTVKYINAPSESRPSSSKSKPDEEGGKFFPCHSFILFIIYFHS